MASGFDHPMFKALPGTVRDRIAEWTKSLATALGDDLVAILLIGGVARGDYRPGESDVNALVVLRDPSFTKLDAISSAMQAVRYGARLEATILTLQEIQSSADAFPLLFDEVKRWHIVLVGEDPLASTIVHDTHRRLRIEQELCEAQIGLRRVITDALGAREAIGGAVGRKVRQVRRPLHALLGLKGMVSKEDVASVLDAVGRVYHVDVAPLADPRGQPDAAHAALSRLLAEAILDSQGIATSESSLRVRVGPTG